MNQKACELINVYTILKLLNPEDSDQFTLIVCCKDIKTVIKNFEIE